jgi:hypothetical protein
LSNTWLESLITRLRGNQSPSDEEEKFLHRGTVFEALKASEAWKLVLDYLEKLADESLTALRADRKHEPLTSMALQIRWQEREQVLKLLQEEVLATIEEAKRIKKEHEEDAEWQTKQN